MIKFSLWTKRLDVMHLKLQDAPKTLCDKPCLGNNYAKDFPDRELCQMCDIDARKMIQDEEDFMREKKREEQ